MSEELSVNATLKELLQKYDVPAPRYTSYPTVPYWSDSPTTDRWLSEVARAAEPKNSTWSIYIHVPYCETLCTFCGCNTSITKDHGKESPYVDLILRELDAYLEKVPLLKSKPLRQLHLGGGSPTFLSESQLERLVSGVLSRVPRASVFEGAIEVDPRRTRRTQIEVLTKLGFNRVSMGVQDFDPEVQRLINRVQPIEMTEQITRWSRELGVRSVNFDLIYGLPKQTLLTVRRMADLTVAMKPDRIALYSFALVPWIKPAQRLFKDSDLPSGAEKRELYELSRQILIDGGYLEIGMDHFALPTDDLALSARAGTLHRNFMGYTDQRTDIMIGLGVSSISETPTCFHQNEKLFPKYEEKVLAQGFATLRGHLLTKDDQLHREQILRFMTLGEVLLTDAAQAADVREFLSTMISDGLVELQGQRLKLTEKGRPFLRNACMALDQRLREKVPETKTFSQAM